jgi:hypothetical protein
MGDATMPDDACGGTVSFVLGKLNNDSIAKTRREEVKYPSLSPIKYKESSASSPNPCF